MGLEVPVGRVVGVFPWVVALVLSACSTAKVMTVRNATAHTLRVRAEFLSATSQGSELDLRLSPESRDSWNYELSFGADDVVDAGLRRFVVSASGRCTVTLDRDALEALALNDGMWEITITPTAITCPTR